MNDFPSTCQTTLSIDSPIHALAFSSGTGTYILTGTEDRKIHLFNPSSTKQSTSPIQTYSAHAHPVLDLAVSADNAAFASVGGDKTVFLWDVTTATTLRRFVNGGHVGKVNCVSFCGVGDEMLVSGSFDGRVLFWDLKSGGQGSKPIFELRDAKDAVSSVSVAGDRILTGSVDGRVRGYDFRMGKVWEDVVCPKGIGSVQWDSQGEGYLVGTLDSKARLMDGRSGGCLKTFEDVEGRFTNTTYRLRSTLAMGDAAAVSGGEDGVVRVWDVLGGKIAKRLKHRVTDGTKRDVVSAIAWNSQKKELATAGGDGRVVIWSRDNAQRSEM